MDQFENWTVQLRKGVLEICILSCLKDKERYGYDLVKKLSSESGLGVTEGTIYPLMSRLKNQGLVQTRLVESSEGPVRKYYELTEDGKKILEMMDKYYDSLIDNVNKMRKGD